MLCETTLSDVEDYVLLQSEEALSEEDETPACCDDSVFTFHIKKQSKKKTRRHYCGIDGCMHGARLYKHMKQHKADVHDIGVVWHFCDVKGCNFRSKHASNTNQHIKRVHEGIYNARRKKQEARVRDALLKAGYIEWFGVASMPPVWSFKHEMKVDFKCSDVLSATAYARIDFVICTPGGLVFLEVDENQHKYGYDAMVSCDMKRMSHVMESLFIELGEALPYIYWLRYNPQAYRVNGDLIGVLKEERERRLVHWLRDFQSVKPTEIGYAFYDSVDGVLDVLRNENYSSEWACVVTNLGSIPS